MLALHGSESAGSGSVVGTTAGGRAALPGGWRSNEAMMVYREMVARTVAWIVEDPIGRGALAVRLAQPAFVVPAMIRGSDGVPDPTAVLTQCLLARKGTRESLVGLWKAVDALSPVAVSAALQCCALEVRPLDRVGVKARTRAKDPLEPPVPESMGKEDESRPRPARLDDVADLPVPSGLVVVPWPVTDYRQGSRLNDIARRNAPGEQDGEQPIPRDSQSTVTAVLKGLREQLEAGPAQRLCALRAVLSLALAPGVDTRTKATTLLVTRTAKRMQAWLAPLLPAVRFVLHGTVVAIEALGMEARSAAQFAGRVSEQLEPEAGGSKSGGSGSGNDEVASGPEQASASARAAL